MSMDNSRNHGACTDIEITLRTGIRRTGDDEVACWLADADGYQNAAGDTPTEALSMVGEQIETDGEGESDSMDPRQPASALFADADSNPFAIAPSDDLPADADPLRDLEAHLTAAVMESVTERSGRQYDDLHSVVRLIIKETYSRQGFTHSQPPAGLRDRQDPTPEDFADTLEDICTDPEQYVEFPDRSLVVNRMNDKAAKLLQLLPQAEDWEDAASATERQQRHQRHRDTTSEMSQ